MWLFRKISSRMKIPVSTVFTICQQPFTPRKTRPGCPRVCTTPIRQRLIHHAISSQENWWKPLAQITKETNIFVNRRILRQAFTDYRYHRHVVCVKPFLTAKSKVNRLIWGQSIRDKSAADFGMIFGQINVNLILIALQATLG